ncbi:MAG: hypothetical protein KBF80_10835 [Flavobacteriales bacterium]|nr:hypothetical protein [Flavobacteriales bacterium]
MITAATDRLQRTAFLCAALGAFAFVVLRAFLVPVTHDEAMTFFLFVETKDFLPFHGGWDAGNHVLCTGLGWLAWKLAGFQLWALRLPSVLAFLLYAAYAWRWGLKLRTPLVRWCLWAALLGMPFLLDFFSLFRGYGLSMAFWSMALYELNAWLEKRGTRTLMRTLTASACATFSGFSLLTLWAAVLAVLFLSLWTRPATGKRRAMHTTLWLFLGLAPWAFAAAWLQELAAHGSLYYGLRTGVFGGTVPSLLKAMFGETSSWARWPVLLALLAGTWAAGRAWRRKPLDLAAWALVLSAGLLWMDMLGREVLFAWKGTLFPEDRTALQWVLPFLLLAAFALDRWCARQANAKWLALLLLALPVRTLATANLSRTSYWPGEAVPGSIFRAAQALQQHAPRLLTIGSYRMEQGVWAFGLRQYGLPLNTAGTTDHPNAGQELLLVEHARTPPPAGYQLVEEAPGGHVALYARVRPWAATLLLDTLVAREPSSDEFMELWHPPVAALHGRRFLVQLDLVLPADQGIATAALVVEMNADTTARYYEDVIVPFLRNPALGDSIHTVRLTPAVPPDATRLVVYFWNAHRQQFGFSGRLRVFAVRQ